MNLLISMIQKDSYYEKLNQKPENFWKYYSRQTSLYWEITIKKLIRIVLVVPANKVDAKRSLSFMNHINHKEKLK